jgi:hypothetical protein
MTATTRMAPTTAIRIPHHGTGFNNPSLGLDVQVLDADGETVNKRLRTLGPVASVGFETSRHSSETVT